MSAQIPIEMSPVMVIPELLIQIFEHLPLRDLISTTHVCGQWRALVPKIESPTRLRLLALCFDKLPSPHPISLDDRVSYVNKVETKYTVLIPEPYRTLLTEWPVSNPPPGMHWPHSVRFHASGFCFCPRHMHGDPDECLCADQEVCDVEITMLAENFRFIMQHGTVPVGLPCNWELFNRPIRLYTEEQNAQTLRFIRAHPEAEWSTRGRTNSWVYLPFRVLQLSRYEYGTAEGASDGTFVMILDGPARGQIHGWSSSGFTWYDGFEADSFWDWNYLEWDRGAVTDLHTVDRD
ncbi:hypothetical protein DFH06DRAFT_1206689 [Mycena polygramma]|nr:hypothetical protein DFH06DRAFT_1206689 [Mycena polygramma]